MLIRNRRRRAKMFFQTNKENGRGAGEGKANLLKLKTIKDDFFSESYQFFQRKKFGWPGSLGVVLNKM